MVRNIPETEYEHAKSASANRRRPLAAINKPCGHSSAQVIRECQQRFNPSNYFKPMLEAEKARLLKESGTQSLRRKQEKKASQVKMGHGGTLDPLATGVLILGIGSGTKMLSQFLDCTKTYETVVVFGASTDTYDRVGRILAKRAYDHITQEKVEEALETFKGKQMQIPPLYSALKMNGKPLYEYAREGKPIPREIEGREIEVLDIELVEWYPPGKHNHRWPDEEAEASERNLAEQVWRIKKQQEEGGNGKKLTAEEIEEDDQALAAHESFKKKFEERQDALIKDSPAPSPRASGKSSGGSGKKSSMMMSGALGQLPQSNYSNRGKDLVPPSPDASTPPPWTDEGPAACRIRLKVTSGFYVRSFCHDLGTKLGSAALMAELCRTRQSDFTVGGVNCLEFDDLLKGEDVWGPQVADMLARWNGEPDSKTAVTKDEGDDKAQAGSKRRRSASPDGSSSERPPRKAAAKATGSDSLQAPVANGRRNSEDEKSWNGFDD